MNTYAFKVNCERPKKPPSLSRYRRILQGGTMKYKRILANHWESVLVPRTNRHINVYKAHLLSVQCSKVKQCMAWYFECRSCVHNAVGERLWDNYEP